MLCKVIVLCAFIVCALGSGTLTPDLDCAFHMTWKKSQSTSITEKYGFKTADDLILMVESYEPDDLPRKDYNLFRSDIKDADGEILFVGFGGNDPKKPKYCQDEYIEINYAWDELAPVMTEFEYEGDGEDVACPNSSFTGCKKYCNANDECVVADDQNRFVVLADNTTVEYKNIVHDVDDFVAINCTTGILHDPPVNPCGNQSSSSSHKGGKLTPELDCAFHMTWKKSQSTSITEKYGFKTADDLILMVESYEPDDLPRKDYNLFRSDIKDADGEILFVGFGGNDPKKPKYCQDEYIEINYAWDELAPVMTEFEYEGDGEDVACPNSSFTGCKKYCNANDECVVADDQNRFVVLADNTTVEYKNIVHDVDDFVAINCTTGILHDPPVNPCGRPSSSSHGPSSHSSSGHPGSSDAASFKTATVIAVIAFIALLI